MTPFPRKKSASNGFKGFMASDPGALARYRQRQRRRLNIIIDGIEPQSKKMSSTDRAAFQTAVTKQLASLKRSTFRGDVALKLDLDTASKSPPHAHTIAKNLLDLLGSRMVGVDWPKKSVLYADDRQIQGLSVQCRHGCTEPRIGIEARSFAAMLEDLELAAEAARATETMEAYYEREHNDDWIKTLRELIRDEMRTRQLIGNELYEAHREMVRWNAQRALLGRSGVDIPMLAWMYGLPRDTFNLLSKNDWAGLVSQSRLRLQVGELPTAAGSSTAFKQRVASEIAAFKKSWDWIIDPLVIAVALEVVVRPNPSTPKAVLHDLDNIVRDYLIPSIVPNFGTVSDQRWTIDFDNLRKVNPKLADAWGPNPTPPKGTRSGVTRYEAWRLPAADGEPGFVSVALVADIDLKGDLMHQVDENISKWRDNIESERRKQKRRW